MEKFKDNDINSMSIIVDYVKDHLIPHISHLDSSKNMYNALTNLFSVKNHFNELLNIVLNILPKTWDAFVASMNTRNEYLTFEEPWTCCAQEESRIITKEKS
jgi:hypothetical protein